MNVLAFVDPRRIMVLQQPSVRLTVISIIVLLSILKELECHSTSGRDHSNAAEGMPTHYLLALAPYPDPVFKPACPGMGDLASSQQPVWPLNRSTTEAISSMITT